MHLWQFVPDPPICSPATQGSAFKNIYNGLNSGGVLILVEKILAENSAFNRSFINYYYDYKRRNQYSELEISQKREALENVLIPYRLSENVCMLNRQDLCARSCFLNGTILQDLLQ